MAIAFDFQIVVELFSNSQNLPTHEEDNLNEAELDDLFDDDVNLFLNDEVLNSSDDDSQSFLTWIQNLKNDRKTLTFFLVIFCYKIRYHLGFSS